MLALKASLPKDESSKTLRPTIDRAKETIDKARKLISDNLNTLLAMENKARASRQQQIRSWLKSTVCFRPCVATCSRSPPLPCFRPSTSVSSTRAFGDDLRKGFEFVSESQWEILQRNALLIVLQIALWLISAIMIIRNRAALAAEPRLLFFAERPFAAGVLVGFVVFLPFYEPGLGVWRVVILAVAALCIARLSGCCITGAWRRRAVYGLVMVLIINEFLQLSDLPRPLFRLYVLFVSLMGLFVCGWRALNSARRGKARLYRWTLWGGAVVSGMMLVANVSGYSALAAHLLEASLRTVLLVILGWILTDFGRGGLEMNLQERLCDPNSSPAKECGCHRSRFITPARFARRSLCDHTCPGVLGVVRRWV